MHYCNHLAKYCNHLAKYCNHLAKYCNHLAKYCNHLAKCLNILSKIKLNDLSKKNILIAFCSQMVLHLLIIRFLYFISMGAKVRMRTTLHAPWHAMFSLQTCPAPCHMQCSPFRHSLHSAICNVHPADMPCTVPCNVHPADMPCTVPAMFTLQTSYMHSVA